MTQASKIDTKHVCIEKGEDLNQRTRNCEELTWFGDEMACDSSEVAKFVALDFEALDVNEALNFRGFDLSFCTLYLIKKKRSPNLKPSFHFPDPPIVKTNPSVGCACVCGRECVCERERASD